jgi:hypothetical protein
MVVTWVEPAGALSVQIERASEPELRIGIVERFAGVRFDERLLVSSARR